MAKLYEQVVLLDSDRADQIEKWLSNTEHQSENETFTVTVQFPDGRQMDVQCCGVQDEDECSWTQAVLFAGGQEIGCTQPGEDFLGIWEIETPAARYRTYVITRESLERALAYL